MGGEVQKGDQVAEIKNNKTIFYSKSSRIFCLFGMIMNKLTFKNAYSQKKKCIFLIKLANIL